MIKVKIKVNTCFNISEQRKYNYVNGTQIYSFKAVCMNSNEN